MMYRTGTSSTIIALEALKQSIETKIAEAAQVTSAGESGSESRPKLA
ncbi:MAG: hypothetical protein NTZ24_11065 [Deltaproteobacteria bacterium]|nr:hypothetical protein [Deltaproteobacteria bacterium]